MTQAETRCSAQVILFRVPEASSGFTSRDVAEIHAWNAAGRRVEIDDCADCGGASQFAMIYRGEEPWASWAVSRDRGQVLLWDCVSLFDIGRYSTMRHALAALPGGNPAAVRLSAEVIPLHRVALAG